MSGSGENHINARLNTMEANNTKDIPRLSIERMVQVFQLEESDAYIPGCLLGTRLSQEGEDPHPLSHPFSLSAFVLLLCEEGSVRIKTESEEYAIEKNHLFINFPGQIIYATDAHDCKMHIAAIDVDFIRNMNLDFKQIAGKLLDLKNCQFMKLDDNAFAGMRGLETCIISEIKDNGRDATSGEILRCLVSALFFQIGREIERHTPEKLADKEMFDKNAGYFKDFMLLLNEHYKKERSVGFYADKMHLSPKYFTTLIKRTSGRTAAEWINQYVILEAKNLLKYSTMNIQEIAYYLNFPNQSFFGKYFKHHSGMTPSEYKRSK